MSRVYDAAVTLLIVLVCLATFRLTRLVVADEFPPTAALRDWVDRRWGEESAQAYLAHCPWCVSVYLGGVIVLLTDHFIDGGLIAPFLVWGTASAVTGLIASVEPE